MLIDSIDTTSIYRVWFKYLVSGKGYDFIAFFCIIGDFAAIKKIHDSTVVHGPVRSINDSDLSNRIVRNIPLKSVEMHLVGRNLIFDRIYTS